MSASATHGGHNERMIFVQSIFHTVSTKVRKQERLTMETELLSFTGGATLYKKRLMKVKLTDTFRTTRH